MSTLTLLLFILFNICHWLADYTPLSSKQMLKAKQFGKPLLPIFAHGGVHGLLMGIPLAFFVSDYMTWALLILFQQITHSIIDTMKGKVVWWIPITRDNTKSWYWIVIGFDQVLHQVVIGIMLFIIQV